MLPSLCPNCGVSVNTLLSPYKTVCTVLGLMLPLPIAVGVTRNDARTKVAVTVQLACTEPMVRRVPEREATQPEEFVVNVFNK